MVADHIQVENHIYWFVTLSRSPGLLQCGKRGFKPENGSPRTLINLRHQQVRKRIVCNYMKNSVALGICETHVLSVSGSVQATRRNDSLCICSHSGENDNTVKSNTTMQDVGSFWSRLKSSCMILASTKGCSGPAGLVEGQREKRTLPVPLIFGTAVSQELSSILFPLR